MFVAKRERFVTGQIVIEVNESWQIEVVPRSAEIHCLPVGNVPATRTDVHHELSWPVTQMFLSCPKALQTCLLQTPPASKEPRSRLKCKELSNSADRRDPLSCDRQTIANILDQIGPIGIAQPPSSAIDCLDPRIRAEGTLGDSKRPLQLLISEFSLKPPYGKSSGMKRFAMQQPRNLIPE